MNKHTKRKPEPFEIWTANLPFAKNSTLKCGCRPVVVISKEGYGELPFVSVVPLTKNLSERQLPTHILLCNRFLDKPSRALCDQVMPLDKKRLLRRIGYVEDAFDRFALRRALANHLNLSAAPGFGMTEEDMYHPMNAG